MSYPPADKPWYCDDVEGEGVTWHATEADALAHAASCIVEWNTADGWTVEVEEIVVGCVTYRARQVNKARCEDGCHGLHDYHCDVAMRPLGIPEEPDPCA